MSDVNEFEEDQGDIFGTVYGDMITFVAVLFMVLFMLVFNETQDKTFFAKMIQIGPVLDVCPKYLIFRASCPELIFVSV